MVTNILWFSLLMLVLLIVSSFNGGGKSVLSNRKSQSKNILRENVLKRKLEKLTESKVKFSKRYKIETMALQAGYKISYAEYLMMSIGSGITLAIVVGTMLNNPMLFIMFSFIGYMLPQQIIAFIKNKRLEVMEKQIGSFMQMVIKRYETTKDFGKSLELTLVEFKGEEPMYSEIKQTVLEINLQLPVSEAMDNLARRTGNKYMARLSDYYKIASSLGTDEIRKKLLTQAFIQYEENRKDKQLMHKELAGVKSEAYIMLGSIPMFAIYQIMTNDKYITFMTQTLIGQIGTTVISGVFMGCLWFINAKIGAPLE